MTDYGLGCSVFTRNIVRGKRVAGRIETGMGFVNPPTWIAADLPFGGIKNSGYGRKLSSHGIHAFMNKKLIRVAPLMPRVSKHPINATPERAEGNQPSSVNGATHQPTKSNHPTDMKSIK